MRPRVAASLIALSFTLVVSGFSRTPVVRPVSWREVAPIVSRLADGLPASLRDIPADQREARWDGWARGGRAAISDRIAHGDEDSLVNLLLFGTSFTSEPRITSSLLADLDRRWKAGDRTAQGLLADTYHRRAAALVTAMTRPRADERLRFGRAVLERAGLNLATEGGRRAAAEYLLATVVRVRQEAAALARALEAARALPDPSAAFAERSRVFRDRGLAPDSSVLTQFAVDRGLAELTRRGTLRVGAIARVAVVGPGLDFADKQEGFDFYPPQSLQPFTVIDSLLRCRAAAGGLTVTTIDVSPRVNTHLGAAVKRATRGLPYRLVLPRDAREKWLDDAAAYWREMGNRIGQPFAAGAPSSLPGVAARGVAVRPDVVTRLQVAAANIVFDRLELADAERFDLVLATNVLVYYDTFEQTLAMASIAAMLRPGGVLLTNDALLEIPDVPLHSGGYLAVPFSGREGDGERMVWYLKDGKW